MIVYVARNLLNGREYFGLTSGSLSRRRREHELDAKRGAMEPFRCALRKYGFESFVWEVVGTFSTREEACQAERQSIAQSKNPYNITPGGDGIPKGYRHKNPGRRVNVWTNRTPEQIAEIGAKISASLKRIGHRPSVQSNLKGKKRSEVFKAKVSAGMKRYAASVGSEEMSRRSRKEDK